MNRRNDSLLSWPLKFLYYIIPFNVGWVFLSVFYQGRGGTLAIIRGLIIIIFCILPYIPKIRLNPITVSVFTFIIYIIMLFPFTSDFSYSLNKSSHVFITLLMLPIGYQLFTNHQSFSKLNNKIFLSYAIVILGLILTNVFNLDYTYIGFTTYSTDIDIHTGGMADSWNNVTYLLLLAPLYLYKNPKKIRQKIFIIFFLILLIILITSFKRIAIAGFIFGFLIFFYFYGKYGKALKYIILVTLFLITLSPLYFDTVLLQYKARSDRFERGALQKESRYKETIAVWDEVFSFENPLKSLFGMEAFNSIGKYGGGKFHSRTAHVDYNLIVITNGLLGLLLYLNIYFQTYRVFRKFSLKVKSDYYKILKSVFFTLFFTSLLTSFAGQMSRLSFRIIIFLYLGAILGMLRTYKQSFTAVTSNKVNLLKKKKIICMNKGG